MGDISLGNGPDFCMWRGLEIVNYRLIFFVKNKDEVVRKRTIVDRSLAMLTRKSKAFLKVVKISKIKEKDRGHFDQNLTLKIEGSECEIILHFCLPYDLLDSQLAIIIKYFEETVFK